MPRQRGRSPQSVINKGERGKKEGILTGFTLRWRRGKVGRACLTEQRHQGVAGTHPRKGFFSGVAMIKSILEGWCLKKHFIKGGHGGGPEKKTERRRAEVKRFKFV